VRKARQLREETRQGLYGGRQEEKAGREPGWEMERTRAEEAVKRQERKCFGRTDRDFSGGA